jgi:hypothetical protein
MSTKEETVEATVNIVGLKGERSSKTGKFRASQIGSLNFSVLRHKLDWKATGRKVTFWYDDKGEKYYTRVDGQRCKELVLTETERELWRTICGEATPEA